MLYALKRSGISQKKKKSSDASQASLPFPLLKRLKNVECCGKLLRM